MTGPLSRRRFLLASMLGAGAWGLGKPAFASLEDRRFQISLNELSLQRAILWGQLDHLDLARAARTQFDIGAVEYLSRFFQQHAKDEKYLMEMNKRAADQNVRQLLIVVDDEGRLGDPNPELRKSAVANHHKWIDAAKALGCHSIKVDTASEGTPDERLGRVAEAVRALCEYAEQQHINVLVGCGEGEAAGAAWLSRVIGQVNHPACGALPTFAGLAASKSNEDVAKLIPLAKAISATAHDFNAEGKETAIDFFRIVPVVLAGGYQGYVGIAYQGERLDELEGIRATKALLEAAQSADTPRGPSPT